MEGPGCARAVVAEWWIHWLRRFGNFVPWRSLLAPWIAVANFSKIELTSFFDSIVFVAFGFGALVGCRIPRGASCLSCVEIYAESSEITAKLLGVLKLNAVHAQLYGALYIQSAIIDEDGFRRFAMRHR
jgi:hypothetical protein